MGLYLNPSNGTKEEWLEANGVLMDGIPTIDDFNEDVANGYIPVVHLDNGAFTAAGFIYNERELQAFTRSDEMRPRKFYLVPRDKALAEVPELAKYLA